MARYVTDEEILQAVEAYERVGTKDGAARELGIPRTTMQLRLKQATDRNLMGHAAGGPMPEGRVLGRTTTLYDMETGQAKMQWVRADPMREQRMEHLVEALKDTFEDYRGKAGVAAEPEYSIEDLATIYMLSDHHLGMYAWAKEAGEDYDVQIARDLLIETMATLSATTPPSKVGVILGLGDFFHTDTNSARTARSGNELDTDSRFAKVLQTGVELVIYTVDQALQKHERVLVRMLPGNHDPYASLALTVALATFYANDPRVFVDTDPSPFFWWEWGSTFVAATHGDQVKPENMAGVMAASQPEMWGRAQFRYAYFGHVHHKSKGGGEAYGVEWETFQALTAKDSWHYGQGYRSGRSMTAITIHTTKGELIRHKVNLVKGETHDQEDTSERNSGL